MELLIDSIAFVVDSALDVLPIAVFLFFFQRVVLGQRLTNWRQIVVGFAFVVIGLGLFLVGLEQTLFPLGRLMAQQLTDPAFLYESLEEMAVSLQWHDYYWVYLFALAVGASTSLAEPAVIAVAMKANAVSGGAIGVWSLRVAIGIGVGLHYFIGVGYLVVIMQTIMAPKLIVPLAYDAGGVTTSTVTVPLVAALGLGLSEAVPGRSALLDGFGLVAFAALFPIISVLAYGQLAVLRERVSDSKSDSRNPEEEEDNAF
jgi:hypothetical protein